MPTDLKVRPATAEDASEIARLSGQLGYPATPGEIKARLRQVQGSESSFVAVAEAEASVLRGWIAVDRRLILESGERAEITGLVVDPRARRQGIGGALVSAAEVWADALGLSKIVVRSNAAREESHLFYPQRGYTRTKNQHVYVNQLR